MVSHLLIKSAVALTFLGSVLYVHRRGQVRHPFLRQLTDHSGFMAPLNVLMYLTSAVPPRPYLDVRDFPELAKLRENWLTIREEALKLADAGRVTAAAKNNDASFNSFFKEGWKRFYLKWYDEPLSSAQSMCPQTVALLESIPSVRAAMFTLLPAGSHLNPHRDPYAGSLRYHLGLITPNSDACRIWVDGQVHSWRDGEDFMFDETYIHSVENNTDQTRLILFCDVERPLRSRVVTWINRTVSRILGRATATSNIEGERIGAINKLFILAYHMGELRRRFKRANKTLYRATKILLVCALIYVLFLR